MYRRELLAALLAVLVVCAIGALSLWRATTPPLQPQPPAAPGPGTQLQFDPAPAVPLFPAPAPETGPAELDPDESREPEAVEDPLADIDTGVVGHPGTAVDPELPWTPANLEKARLATLGEALRCFGEHAGESLGSTRASLHVRVGPTDIVAVELRGGDGWPAELQQCARAAPTAVTWPAPEADMGFVVPLVMISRAALPDVDAGD